MSDDPLVLEVGDLEPCADPDELLVVGVDHGAVTVQLGNWPRITLTSSEAEEFARLFVRACWLAAAQGGAP